MPDDLVERAAAVLRAAAERAIVPRFRNLAAADVDEKSPGELVTLADKEAEALIAAGLADLLPGSRVVGEEGCAADPRLLDTIDDGSVWLVDPLDGTANFVAGDPHFAVMAALLHDGETRAAVIVEPLTGRICAAERGSGAWIDGVRFRADAAPVAAADLRHVVGRFMPPGVEEDTRRRLAPLPPAIASVRAASIEYPLIATGERDAAFYWRTLPWDHAAGVLFIEEAGGRAARPGGVPWRASRAGNGLIVARSPAIWDAMDRLLAGVGTA